MIFCEIIINIVMICTIISDILIVVSLFLIADYTCLITVKTCPVVKTRVPTDYTESLPCHRHSLSLVQSFEHHWRQNTIS